MTEQPNKPTTEAEAVTALALESAGLVPVEMAQVHDQTVAFYRDHHGGVGHLVFQENDDHGNLKNKPCRVAQGVTIETAPSLVSYVRDFKGDGTRIFADISTDTLVAVLDYHEGRTSAVADLGGESEGDDSADFTPAPDFGQHVATLRLKRSEEWELWAGKDGQLMDQVSFARFLYENAQDVADPSGADLLDVVKDLRASRSKSFTGDLNLGREGVSFDYSDRQNVSAKDSVTIPERFTLSIPVYFGEGPVTIQAHLRHEVDEGGRLNLGFKLLRRESVRQATFQSLVDRVAAESGAPAVYGRRS